MSKLEKVKSELAKYDYIRFAVCDLNGFSRGQIVPKRNVAKYLESGVEMFQGLLLHGSEAEPIFPHHEKDYTSGNMTMIPDLDTLRPIPWAGDDKVKVAELLCQSHWKIDNSPHEACPRYVVQQQLKRLEDMGLQLYSGFEMEHFLLHADTMKPLFDGKLYMDHRNQNRHAQMLFDFDGLLMESGVDLERFPSEDAPGMFEVIMKPTYGIECPDGAFNLKQGLMEIADTKGIKASFISKMDLNECGAGTHFSFSLLSNKSGENVLYDANTPDKLPVIAKQWIAGLIKHSRALTAFNSPTPNCYRRLHQPWAPSTIYWGIEDRAAMLSVKNNGPSGTYIENRVPSGKSNPYLVVAATVAAGLDGILNKLECPPQGTFENSEPLPKSFTEALEALTEDKAFVKSIGQEVVSWFLKVKDVDVHKFKALTNEESIALERKLFL